MNTSRENPSRRTRRVRRGVALAAASAAALSVAPWPALASVQSPARASVQMSAQSPVRASAHATTAAVPSPAMAAVGKLAPSGCTTVSQQASCDLYAMSGTTQLLGQSVPIWGFSTTGDAGSATAPGPVLVVNEGDTVSVTLHNQLSENVSLSLPGQPASAFTSGLSVAEQTQGAAPGGTSTYTFKADRPGTFMYEAGHTPDGARQVAMGLAGALVVLPADGTASGQAYDDEAVLVLSEIDPALNAHPDTFDMRDFKPTWRLINGRPFPSTPEIPTDQGHTVLLRYVNVGSVTHPMSLLGADQLEVARDGHPASFSQREVVAAVQSGSTVDTLVSMPTGPDTKVTLFEEGSHLDNAGQTEADPTKVAMGGMMTFLDTNAPPVLDDLVGPAPSHVTVTPRVSDGLSPVTVEADLSDVRSGGSNLTAAELLVDDAGIAVGFGVPMTGTFGSPTGHVTASIPAVPDGGASCTPDTGPAPVALSCLAAGKHILYVRGQDAAGNWGVLGSAVLNLPKTGPATTGGSVSPSPANGSKAITVSATGDDSDAEGDITQAELFVDTVGADGAGVAMGLNKVAPVVSETGTIPATPPTGQTCASSPVAASCLTEGTHHVFVHSKDSLGLWGPTLDIPVTIDVTGPSVDAAAVSPNPSNGLVSSPGDSGYLKVSALVTDRDNGGALQDKVVAAEGFFAPSSNNPAPGTGFGLLAVDGTYDSTSENVYGLIPLSEVKAKPDGTYQVYVRAKDEAGNWGPLFAMPLVVDKTAPALGALTGSPNPTNGAALLTLSAPVTKDTAFQTAEFWTGTTDPGVGRATRVPVSFVNGSAVVTVPLANIAPGSVRFNLRVQDMAGNWSNAVNTTVTVTRPNAIFSDTFDSGNLNAWSALTNTGSGSMTVAAAAGIPTAAGNLGLAVTGTGTHYVTDNTPVAETGYHASFEFSPNTFTSGTAGAVTVFDARDARASVVSVDFRKNAGTNQVRVFMARSSGGNLTSAWQNLTPGAHTIRVDWVSGPATGAGQGSLKLSVDGAAVVSLTGNTSTLRIESARLGLVAGQNNSSTGTAYFDSFRSTRFTLP